ncbi:hypothetical protein [Elioraea tepidiphila]|jgi:hypothetical protein|uniref:hypothetical protein n=1 Tax=Elioraea tepidiphila TaxID=457934 RepID=UPI002FDA891D
MVRRDPHRVAARIVQDAGGKVVGRTRMQKITYLAQLAGFPAEFAFEYRHYGPFSEDLATGLDIASALGQLTEEVGESTWGGIYSIYRLPDQRPPADPARAAFLQKAKEIGAIELELAATAAFLFAEEGIGRDKPGNPWHETRKRKPQKSGEGRLEAAARAYGELRLLNTPKPLPELPPP